MKRIILIVIVVAIAGLTVWVWKGGSMPDVYATPSTETLKTYSDPQGVFSFQYQPAFSVTGRDESALAKVTIPRSYMPSTNFSEAVLAINWSSGATDTSCSGRSTESDAAAGNRYETTTIKKIYDGDCYSFAYTIHSTNIGNYDPSQGITEFDKEKIVSELESIVQSFRLLVNSD